VMESTYGDRAHRSWEDTWAELDEVFTDMQQRRGNILIPAFAVGRTQELLYAFKRNYERWNLDRWAIFLDSPMAIEATEVYGRHYEVYDREARGERRHNGDIFDLPNLHLTRTAQQSMRINRIESGAIIIAGSGMCEGGRIKHHLKHNIWRRNCHVVFVGYQAQGTLGRKLIEGYPHVKIFGRRMEVRCRVRTINGLSAHADWSELLEHLRPLAPTCRQAFVVHGEEDAAMKFADRLEDAGFAQVDVPLQGERFELGTAAAV